MELSELGLLITGPRQRDAVHIAVTPMEAGEALKPGQHVHVHPDGKAWSTGNTAPVGVVDPFLYVHTIKPGEHFWLFMEPGSVMLLRHEWTHPSVPLDRATVGDHAVAGAKGWLTAYAEAHGTSYEALLDGALAGSIRFGVDTPEELWDEDGKQAWEGWRYVELVSGKKVDPDFRATTIFSCAC